MTALARESDVGRAKSGADLSMAERSQQERGAES